MNNVKSIISKHNTRITGKSKPQCEVIDPCTCRDKKTCPLQEKCMTKDMVYKATVTTSNTNSTKHYIGMSPWLDVWINPFCCVSRKNISIKIVSALMRLVKALKELSSKFQIYTITCITFNTCMLEQLLLDKLMSSSHSQTF